MKFDKEVVDGLIRDIQRAITNGDSFLKLGLKEIIIVKQINETFVVDLIEEESWNGFGRTRLGKHLQNIDFVPVLKWLFSIPEQDFKKRKR